MSNQWQPVKARCSPATFAMLAKLQDVSAAEAVAYQNKLTCSLGQRIQKVMWVLGGLMQEHYFLFPPLIQIQPQIKQAPVTVIYRL